MSDKIDLQSGSYPSGRGVLVTIKRFPHPDSPNRSEYVEIAYGSKLKRFLPDVERCTVRAVEIFGNYCLDQTPHGEPIPEGPKRRGEANG